MSAAPFPDLTRVADGTLQVSPVLARRFVGQGLVDAFQGAAPLLQAHLPALPTALPVHDHGSEPQPPHQPLRRGGRTRIMERTSSWALLALLAVMTALLAGCERPPIVAVQSGYRGTGMDHIANPRLLETQVAKQQAPAPLEPASPDGPKAGEVYQNVQVLRNQSVGEFARTMVAITAWVAPEKGCVHCHNPQNFADDSLYTKIVARRMLVMNQKINADWQSHVKNTGVTCYTCHRGQPVPSEVWFKPIEQRGAGFIGNRAGQNEPTPETGYASLPTAFSAYLLGDDLIRVQGLDALPNGNRQSTKQAEWTYGLMAHMSRSLGVNCTQCHNSRSWQSWGQSSPPRLQAWHGIRMVRELNNEYLVPLTSTFPAQRLGPMGDVAKLNCATCHQGVNKPLLGVSMAKFHPELLTSPIAAAAAASAAMPGAAASATPAPAPAASTALRSDDVQRLSALITPRVSTAAP